MQRITNVQYPPGAIVRGRLPREYCGIAYEYLNGRPLIVISQQSQMFDNLIVIPCGSRNRPGIEINIWDYKHNRYVSDHDKSLAYPYNLTQIRVNFIEETLGFIDSFTMKEIMRCVQYHLGLSDYIPPYMAKIHEELYAPRYSLGTEDNTQLSDPHPMIGKYHALRMGYPYSHGGSDAGLRYDSADDPLGDAASSPEPDENLPIPQVLKAPKDAPVPNPPEEKVPKPSIENPNSGEKAPAESVSDNYVTFIQEFVNHCCTIKQKSKIQRNVWYKAFVKFCQEIHSVTVTPAILSQAAAIRILRQFYPSVSEKKTKTYQILQNIDLKPTALPIIEAKDPEPKKVVLKPPAQKLTGNDPNVRINPKTKEVVKMIATTDDGITSLYRPCATEEAFGDIDEPKQRAVQKKVPETEHEPRKRLSNNYESEIAALSENERIQFLIGNFDTQLEAKVPENPKTRSRMKQFLVNTISKGDIVKLCNQKLNGRDQNWRFLSDSEKLVLIMYGDLKAVNITKVYLAARIRELGRKYGIHIQDHKFYRIPNYKTLITLIP